MPIKNLHLFNRDLDKAIERNRDDVNTFLQVVAMNALRGFVLKTPVLTGRARGNWQPGIDAEPQGVLETTDMSGEGTIASGNAIILAAKDFTTIWLTNNVHYISFLENGHSGKAPRGMVAITLEEMRKAL